MSEPDPTSSQVVPGEGSIPGEHLTCLVSSRLLLPSEQNQLSITGAAGEVEDQPLKGAVEVLHLQQSGGQGGHAAEGNEQGTVDLQGRGLGVGYREGRGHTETAKPQ